MLYQKNSRIEPFKGLNTAIFPAKFTWIISYIRDECNAVTW